MNNFCTKCGTKLNENMITCPNCNLAIVDNTNAPELLKAKREQGKKFNNKVLKIILIILTVYISFSLARHTYNILDIKTNIKTQLSNQEYKKISISNIKQCKKCTGSCDGSCFEYKRIPNCYVYSLKITFKNKDIIKTSAQYSLLEKEFPNNTIDNYFFYKNIIDKHLNNSYENIVYKENKPNIEYSTSFKENLDLKLIESLVNINSELLSTNTESSINLNYKDNYSITIHSTDPSIIFVKSFNDGTEPKTYSFYNYFEKNFYHGSMTEKFKTNEIALKELKEWIKTNE